MNLPLFFAGRYLFARKSHNVINIISAISAIGMAIGTAALTIILSVYNGFDSLIKDNLGDIDPDVLVTPVSGKVFVPDSEAFDWAYDNPSVRTMSSVLQENVFVNYDGHQSLAKAKGVDDIFEEENTLAGHVRLGEFKLHHGDVSMCAVGSVLAYSMNLNPSFLAPLDIYYPARDRNISISNPAASLDKIRIHPSCTISLNTEQDNSIIVLPIEDMRELLHYDNEVSAVEIRFAEGCTKAEQKEFIKGMKERLGDGYRVSDRFRQNESLYKMMRYEKAAIFLILIFVIIIIAFNIFGSLSMLIIEKEGDIGTLRCLGAPERTIKRIFVLEGWFISLLGLVAGLAIGIGFAFLQQKTGFIRMPGNYLVTSYPVIIRWTDVAATAAGVALIGYLIALLPVASYYKTNR